MTAVSRIESFPSELLENITRFLTAFPDKKAWRLVSKRFSSFGAGLVKTLDVYMTRDSLRIVNSVAQHPILCKEVLKVTCWLPFFYETLVHEAEFKEAVRKQQGYLIAVQTWDAPEEEPRFMSEYDSRASTVLSILAKGPLKQYTEIELNVGLQHYNTYFMEQDHILHHDLVPALTYALSQFPKLRKVNIGYLGNDRTVACTNKHVPMLDNDVLLLPGRFLPREEVFPPDFMHQIIGAVAAAGCSLNAFEIDNTLFTNWWDMSGHEFRTLEMSATEYTAIESAFKNLQRLSMILRGPQVCFNDPPTRPLPHDRFERILRLAPRLQELKLVLPTWEHDATLPHPHTFLLSDRHNLFGETTFTYLRILQLRECFSIPAEGFMEFLGRHTSLVQLSMAFCRLADNVPWHTVFSFLRGWSNRWCTMELIRLRNDFGEAPFVDDLDEKEQIEAYVYGYGNWTADLDEVYGEQDEDD